MLGGLTDWGLTLTITGADISLTDYKVGVTSILTIDVFLDINAAIGDGFLIKFESPYTLDTTYGPFMGLVGTDCGVNS